MPQERPVSICDSLTLDTLDRLSGCCVSELPGIIATLSSQKNKRPHPKVGPLFQSAIALAANHGPPAPIVSKMAVMVPGAFTVYVHVTELIGDVVVIG